MFEPDAIDAAAGMKPWLEGLNGRQREAVLFGDGPLLVLAGAGSGKTMTLACRVAELVSRGVAPERILLLTFTRRATREMLSRAARFAAHLPVDRVWGGTFHSVGNRLLRIHGRAIGLQPDFTVMDQADAADLMNLIRGELGLGRGERRFPRKETLADIYSRTVNAGTRLAEVLDHDFPWCRGEMEGIREVFRRYTARKRDQNVADYDDLLLYWNALVQAPGVGERVAGLFDHILVDEYQDTNAVQADILKAMRSDRPNLMVVGDDAQAIYSFRSATNANILGFPADFPGAHVVTLDRNYRSTQPILDASNAAIALAKRRFPKDLWTDRRTGERPVLVTCRDEAEQSDAVCRAVLEHRERGVALKRQAVLFRAAHHSDALEIELARRNIPFVKYGGLKFLEAAHVKDVMALLRIVENPTDEVSWFRVLQLLEGVGPATARRLLEELGVRRGSAGRSPLAVLLEDPPAVPSSAREPFEQLREAVADCTSPADLPPAPQVDRLRRFMGPVVHRLYPAPAARLRDLEQLEAIAGRFPTRSRFIAELTLDPPASTGDLAGPPLQDEDFLILSTMHSAKGCEWDVVHVIHAADGMIPSDMATGEEETVEEERRLFYVALTRARDALSVYFPLRYYRRNQGLGDAHAYAQLTRFLPESVREHFDHAVLATDRADDVEGFVAAGTARVEGYLASLWE